MILNMRKMEVEKNILRMSPAPFNEWLQNILNDFKDELSLRNISLIFAPDTAIDSMYFDHSQCEIIINNLLKMPINSAKKTLPLQFPLIWKATGTASG